MKTKLLLSALLFFFSFHSKNINAQGWSSAGGGMNSQVYDLEIHNDELYVGGQFTTIGGIPLRGVAKWTGSAWDSIGQAPMLGTVLSLASYNSELYVAGNFTSIDGMPIKYIARWNGTTWSSVGAGVTDQVVSMIVYNNELYVTGAFDSAGSVPANSMAKWNGTNWSALGTIPEPGLPAMYVYNGLLYNIGYNISTWNGFSWNTIGVGVGGGPWGGIVHRMAEYNGELYVGGIFSFAGGIPVNNIAKWNGSIWSDVGGGVTQCSCSGPTTFANVMEVYDGELYVGGIFELAGGIPAIRIAKWNGSTWSSVCDISGGSGPIVRALKAYNGELYVGGRFTTAGGVSALRIAKWSSPKATVTPAAVMVCSGSPATLTANSGNYTYQWYLNDNAISGATNQQLTVTAAGNYSVVTSVNGLPCEGTVTSTYSVVTTGTGPTNVSITSSSTVGCAPNTIYVGYGAQSITLTANATGAVSYLWSTGATTQSISVTTAGTYSVIAYDAYGCASSPTPETQTTINVVDARCGNDKKKITICHVPDGNPANSQTICIAPSAAAAHLALHAGDCVGECVSSAREIISADEEENVIIIEPNPATNEITVQSSKLKVQSVEIFNLLGENVFQSINQQFNNSIIDVSSQPNSIYFVQVKTKEQTITRKVLISR